MLNINVTDKGFAILEGAIRDSVLRSVGLGIFSDDADRAPIITMPKVSSISANDRALRKVTGIKVSAYMAGAVHFCEINLAASI